MKDPVDVFQDYFSYLGVTECPDIFHRWSLISAVATLIGRRAHIPLGRYKILPNMYIILMGISGSRKSSAIFLIKELLTEAGYKNYSADRTSKEKFISDLQELNTVLDFPQGKEFADVKLNSTEYRDAECFIVSDEMQDFLGQGNIDFITMLGKLWDTRDTYENRIKSGKSSLVYNPCINILGGNTPTGFSLTFPPEIVGQGFLSRLLLVHGDRVQDKVTFPEGNGQPSDNDIIGLFKRLQTFNKDKFSYTADAKQTLDKIYKTEITVADPRFEKYETRRFTHLLKICATISVMGSNEGIITSRHAVIANTLLYYIERKFDQALGEFGRSKHSEAANTILERLAQGKMLTVEEIWNIVSQDVTTRKELMEILRGLQSRKKVQIIDCADNRKRFAANAEAERYFDDTLLMPEILTEQEIIRGGW